MRKPLLIAATVTTLALAVTPLAGAAVAGGQQHEQQGHHHGHRGHHPMSGPLPGGYKHLVVIYEENHSFDNLYGDWGSVDGQQVRGLSDPAVATHSAQVDQDAARTPFTCLFQDDVNLATPPLSATCHDPHAVNQTTYTAAMPDGYDSHFGNAPYSIDDYIGPTDKTCPDPATRGPDNGVPKQTGLPGGCTRDLVHRFYQEQYQIDGGRQDRYMSGSDAVGLTMGHYDTRQLPVYRYLHSAGAPKYVVADNFFQSAFGGSFLNHQWLVAARTPLDTGGATPTAANSTIDSNGMPIKTPLYTPTGAVADNQLTQKCADGMNHYEDACGNFAVNTVQPSNPPYGNGAKIPLINDTDYPNIGDELSDAGISWNWYSGGWDNALTDFAHAGEAGYVKKAPLFQFHHQPLNYFANYAPGQPGRAHLQDETKFIAAAKDGTLPTVSFVKPYGAENEHPGYASEPNGSDHLVDLLKAVTEGGQAGNTLVVVTYDEFGGQWDHVSPPSLANGAQAGTADKWGPGTRIPALVVARNLRHDGVDHTAYDTTSIVATIEDSFGLAPLGSRDAAVNPLDNAVAAGGR